MSKKDHVAGLAIQIPEKMIADVVRSEIVKAIPNPERWVQEIVRQSLNEEDRNSYGRRTKFETAINKEIRALAEGIFKEWLAEQKDAIREQLVTELNRRNKSRVKEVAALLADSLAQLEVRGISLGVKER